MARPETQDWPKARPFRPPETMLVRLETILYKSQRPASEFQQHAPESALANNSCSSVQTLNIAEQSRSCDMLFYRSNNPARCLQMLGCDSSLNSCVSYIGDTYTCDGSLQTRTGDTSYICNCAARLQSAPASDGSYTFASGQVPESDGCGLPAFAAAVSSDSSTVPSTSLASTPQPVTVTSTVQAVSTQTLQASITPSSQSPSSSVQAFSFGLSVGAKAGFAVGIAAGVTIIGLVGYLLYRRRRQSKYPDNDEGHHYVLRRELSPVVCEKLDEGKFVYLVNRRL